MRYRGAVAVFTALIVIFALIGPVCGQDTERININKASAAELAKLQKVGPKYAVRIIEHRPEIRSLQTDRRTHGSSGNWPAYL